MHYRAKHFSTLHFCQLRGWRSFIQLPLSDASGMLLQSELNRYLQGKAIDESEQSDSFCITCQDGSTGTTQISGPCASSMWRPEFILRDHSLRDLCLDATLPFSVPGMSITFGALQRVQIQGDSPRDVWQILRYKSFFVYSIALS